MYPPLWRGGEEGNNLLKFVLLGFFRFLSVSVASLRGWRQGGHRKNVLLNRDSNCVLQQLSLFYVVLIFQLLFGRVSWGFLFIIVNSSTIHTPIIMCNTKRNCVTFMPFPPKKKSNSRAAIDPCTNYKPKSYWVV